MIGWPQTLATAQSNGTALVAAAAASMLPSHAKFPMAAGFLFVPGQQLWLKAGGVVSTVITNPGTVRFDIRFGATIVFDSQAILLDAVAAHAAKPWWLDLYLTLTTVGAVATLMGHGQFTSEIVKGSGAMPVGSVVAMLPWNASPANGNAFDATASQLIDLFFTQTVATGSIQLQQYSLIAMN